MLDAIYIYRMMQGSKFDERDSLISSIPISLALPTPKYNRHKGCTCPDGWDGDHCEIQVNNVPSAVGELAHEVGEVLSANDIVWIAIGAIFVIFVLIYFRRYHVIKQRGKASTRRGRRKNQEMTSYSDTRDII